VLQVEKYLEVFERFNEQRNRITRLWNIGQQTADLLKMIVLIKVPKIVLELGTSNGYSTFHIAMSLTSEAIVYTIDVEPARQDLAKENLKKFNNIRFISMRIEDYIPMIDYNIDLLFIDANKTNYLTYLKALEDKLSKNAVIIADNINSHTGSIKQFLLYIKRCRKKYQFVKLDIETGVVIAIYCG